MWPARTPARTRRPGADEKQLRRLDQRIARLGPDRAVLPALLGERMELRGRLGDEEGMLADADALLGSRHADPPLRARAEWVVVALILRRGLTDRLAEAVELSATPPHPAARVGAGRGLALHAIALQRLGRREEALAALDAGLAQIPADDRDRADVVRLAVTGRWDLGRPADALAQVEMELRRPGEAAAVIMNIGAMCLCALWRTDRIADAETWAQGALLRFPDDPGVRHTAGMVQVLGGRPQEGLDQMRAALDGVDPSALGEVDTAIAHLFLAAALASLGRDDEARHHLAQADGAPSPLLADLRAHLAPAG